MPPVNYASEIAFLQTTSRRRFVETGPLMSNAPCASRERVKLGPAEQIPHGRTKYMRSITRVCLLGDSGTAIFYFLDKSSGHWSPRSIFHVRQRLLPVFAGFLAGCGTGRLQPTWAKAHGHVFRLRRLQRPLLPAENLWARLPVGCPALTWRKCTRRDLDVIRPRAHCGCAPTRGRYSTGRDLPPTPTDEAGADDQFPR
jgi:hypothetical protein